MKEPALADAEAKAIRLRPTDFAAMLRECFFNSPAPRPIGILNNQLLKTVSKAIIELRRANIAAMAA